MTAFSQKGTVGFIQNDTTVIRLPKPVAKEVVKDLIKLDSSKTELAFLKSNYSLLQRNLQLKDSVISYKDSVIGSLKDMGSNYEKMLSIKDQQLSLYKKSAEDLQSSLKKEIRKNARNSLFFTILAAATVYFIIK